MRHFVSFFVRVVSQGLLFRIVYLIFKLECCFVLWRVGLWNHQKLWLQLKGTDNRWHLFQPLGSTNNIYLHCELQGLMDTHLTRKNFNGRSFKRFLTNEGWPNTNLCSGKASYYLDCICSGTRYHETRLWTIRHKCLETKHVATLRCCLF